MFRLCYIGIVMVLLLAGCRNNIAPDPYVITPPNHCRSWNPCVEGRPIPGEYVVDPFCCEGCFEEKVMGLAELIEIALANSYQTRATWAETRVTAATYGTRLSIYYPELSITGYFEAVRKSNYFATNNIFFLPGIQAVEVDEFREYGPELTLSYLIFDWGARDAETELFRQRVWHANWSHNREVQTVIQQVTIDFYNVLAKQEQVGASEANLFDARTVLDATEKKQQYGIDDESNTLIAKTQVSKQMIALLQAESGKETSEAQLTADLSIPANTSIAIRSEFQLPPNFDLDKFTLDECIAQALLSRPDLFAAFNKIKSAEAAVKFTIRDQFPKISLVGSGAKAYFDEGLSDGEDYGLKVSVDFPLFSGFKYQNRIREAKSLLQKARAEFLELENTILKDVVTYYREFEIAVKNLKVNEDYVKTAQASYESTLSQYKAGTKDITTVVNAQTELATARYSLVEAKNSWFSSLVNLAYAAGVLDAPSKICGGRSS